jgi:cell division protein FtsL
MAVAFRLPSLTPRPASTDRPRLVIVEKTERRYLKIFSMVAVVAFVLMAVVILRVHMAQQQMRLDRLNYDISRARLHFDELRAERASLQSPENLIAEAKKIGLLPGRSTRIVDIPPAIAAEVAATVGKVDEDVVKEQETALDEFGRLKATVVNVP